VRPPSMARLLALLACWSVHHSRARSRPVARFQVDQRNLTLLPRHADARRPAAQAEAYGDRRNPTWQRRSGQSSRASKGRSFWACLKSKQFTLILTQQDRALVAPAGAPSRTQTHLGPVTTHYLVYTICSNYPV